MAKLCVKCSLVIFFTLITIVLLSTYYYKFDNSIRISLFQQNLISRELDNSKNDHIQTRDFYRYDCQQRKRIGGFSKYIKNANNPLWRIDGAWFVCFDNDLAPVKDNCNVLSFGINLDYTFDQAINRDYGCLVHSFDPYIEADIFANVRKSDKKLKNSTRLKVNNKWIFHRIGLTGPNTNFSFKNNAIKDKAGLMQILEYTKLKHKTIDIFKMDIEGGEKSVLEHLDVDYACKYFKQIMLETHINMGLEAYKLVRKLEKCFFLFHRETRFYVNDRYVSTGHITEFQDPTDVLLPLKYFANEIVLANYMFAMGELYFVNENFLNSDSQNQNN